MRRHDFGRLKQHVAIGQVLAHYGLDEALRPGGGELVGPCPLPGHRGDCSNRSAFCVNPGRSVWRCFTSCGGGDVVDLVRHVEQCGFAQAARVLDRLASAAPPAACAATPAAHPRPASSRAPFAPYTRTLHLEPDHPFLLAKGIRADVARRFETGAWLHGGFLERCVGVRLHDLAGNPLGYAGRRLEADDAARLGKWKLPPRFPKASVLFGYHRARTGLHRGVVVVEGPFDAMRVHQAGHCNIVALMGTDLSAAQRDLLCAAPCVVLLFDGDDAGRAGARRAAAMLEPTPVRIAELPGGVNPVDLSDEELHRRIASALPQPLPARGPNPVDTTGATASAACCAPAGSGPARPAKAGDSGHRRRRRPRRSPSPATSSLAPAPRRPPFARLAARVAPG